ncbi:pectinesterase inhibitor 10-like isoform X1 [Astyanax mexicanus]|uniref:Pectinesterase inhibitor 10-like isoform X1 n=1 Tax=Astyanax mexicanus TaxID=7994 RepID=A0A8T2MKD3_ASTMX|nr:pectinesterase inhibitor 10-like isoform X1 [Astyanax mexicanus]
MAVYGAGRTPAEHARLWMRLQLQRTHSMSSDVDRKAVLRTTKVRTALKKDGSWIRRSTDQEDPPPPLKPVVLAKPLSPTVKSSTTSTPETLQSPAPQTSSPLSPAPQTTSTLSPAPQTTSPSSPTLQTTSPSNAAPQIISPSNSSPQMTSPPNATPQTSPTSGASPNPPTEAKGRVGGSYVLSAMRKFE